MTLPPIITAERIGHQVHCPACMQPGQVDDVTDDGRVVIVHNNVWHIIGPEQQHEIEFSPPLYEPEIKGGE